MLKEVNVLALPGGIWAEACLRLGKIASDCFENSSGRLQAALWQIKASQCSRRGLKLEAVETSNELLSCPALLQSFQVGCRFLVR